MTLLRSPTRINVVFFDTHGYSTLAGTYVESLVVGINGWATPELDINIIICPIYFKLHYMF